MHFRVRKTRKNSFFDKYLHILIKMNTFVRFKTNMKNAEHLRALQNEIFRRPAF